MSLTGTHSTYLSYTYASIACSLLRLPRRNTLAVISAIHLPYVFAHTPTTAHDAISKIHI